MKIKRGLSYSKTMLGMMAYNPITNCASLALLTIGQTVVKLKVLKTRQSGTKQYGAGEYGSAKFGTNLGGVPRVSFIYSHHCSDGAVAVVRPFGVHMVRLRSSAVGRRFALTR